MTTITTIRIDHAALPPHVRELRADALPEVIEAMLREDGITADVSDVISHIKIEVPTKQLTGACTVLADLELI